MANNQLINRFLFPATVTSGCFLLRGNSSSKSGCDGDKVQSKIVFLGTGSSTGCPRPSCSLLFSERAQESLTLKNARDAMEKYCHVSKVASRGSPKYNKNYRNNPSLLVMLEDGTNVIIDVGKTFRESALRWLPEVGATQLDAIILTHQHMDAVAGLDDVRGFQRWTFDGEKRLGSIAMPLFLSSECLEALQEQFPWLLPKAAALVSEERMPRVERHVASFQVAVFEKFSPFTIGTLKVTPLPVIHGEDLVSYGFSFTVGRTNVVYLSDISRMLPETLDYIRSKLPPTDVLIIDALNPDQRHPVHYSMEQAIMMSREIAPKKMTYLVGMNCDAFPLHDDMNRHLRQKYGNIQFAHDGLVLET
jgi:phosphoribosyl 1,2-cyclic phosphodiesterase